MLMSTSSVYPLCSLPCGVSRPIQSVCRPLGDISVQTENYNLVPFIKTNSYKDCGLWFYSYPTKGWLVSIMTKNSSRIKTFDTKADLSLKMSIHVQLWHNHTWGFFTVQLKRYHAIIKIDSGPEKVDSNGNNKPQNTKALYFVETYIRFPQFVFY